MSVFDKYNLKDVWIANILGKRVVVCRPYARAFGHMAWEMLIALHVANREGWSLYVQKETCPANTAIYSLRSDYVTILAGNPLLDGVLGLLRKLSYWTTYVSFVAKRYLSNLVVISKPRRIALKAATQQLNECLIGNSASLQVRDTLKTKPYFGSYFRRLIVSEIPVRFAASEEARLARMAAKLWGMDENSKIVTLHVRETEDAWDKQNARKRNATVSNYIPAIDFLMSRGYKIIRIGKLPRQRLEYQGLIDLATSPHRTDLLELWLLSRSEFFIGCDSGPTPVAYLLNKPVVLVNIIDPYSIPLRSGSIYILKHVFDRSVDRTLSLQELINEKYLTTIKDINRYAWLENSAEEILEAVKEMHASLSRKFRLCAEQIAFKEKLYSVAEAIKDTPGHKLAFFFGSDPVFVGDGHIAHFYARKHWNTSPILESIGKGK